MFDNIYLKKGILYILLIHAISFLNTLVIVLILPKLFSVEDYGYWQVYLLYTGYVGLTHFGFMDGMYLKLLGKGYDELDIKELKSHFITQIIIQTMISLLLCIYCFLTFKSERLIVFIMVAVSVPIINLRTYFQYILQATGKIKQYSILQILDRICLVLFILVLFLFNKTYLSLVIGDIATKIVLLIVSMYFCKDIVLSNSMYVFDKNDFIDTINVGLKIMVANLCGSLLIGISKFFVDGNFSIEIFSQYSLALTFASMFVSIFASVGIVLMPYIKNKDFETNKNLYISMHVLTSVVILFVMIFYYPIYLLSVKWLPNYEMSFKLMSILLPILYLECQFNFVDSTYMKTYRLEKKLMFNYLFSTVFNFVMSFIVLMVFHDVVPISIILVVSFIIRNILCQINLSNELQITKVKFRYMFFINTFLFPLLFCISNAIIKYYSGFVVFAIVYIMYLVFILKHFSFVKTYIERIIKNE